MVEFGIVKEKIGRSLRLSLPLNTWLKGTYSRYSPPYGSIGAYRWDLESGGGEAAGEGGLVEHLGRRRGSAGGRTSWGRNS